MPVRAVAPGPNREPNQYYQAISRSVEIDPRAITALMWVPTPVPPPKPPVRPILAPQVVNKVSAAIAGYDPSSCVSYVKFRRPDLDVPWGTPKRYASTHELSKEPWVGAVGISSEGPVWHTWVVESIASDSMVISEVNFLGDYLSTRSMPLDNPDTKGFD